ncbi:MAG: hypothetical protein NTV43_06175 [Methylococcales bacterium]|nr:hypothetical protein [Methylococcales bacterium]
MNCKILERNGGYLYLHRYIYEIAVKNLLDNINQLSKNELLQEVQKIVHYAINNFNGLLSDYRLELLLNDVGINIDIGPFENQEKSDVKNILHIATTLYNVGGHTRVIRNWISQDKINRNSLVLVNQAADLNSDLELFFKNCYQYEKINPDMPLLDKASALRTFILKNNFDLIILHIHPDDVVTIVALSIPSLPPVIFYNHADHLFSLGVSVSDAFIDFREKGKEFSLNNRGCTKSYVLPYPLEPKNTEITKALARQQLGLNENDIVLTTMASAYKYKPVDDINFFLLYAEFLEDYPDIKFYAIGVNNKDYDTFTNYKKKPDNLFLLGNVTDPKIYLIASDYFIEPFPFGTGLGTFDAVRYGSFPIFSFKDYSIYGDSAAIVFPAELCNYKNIINKNFKESLYHEFTTNSLKNVYMKEFQLFLATCEEPRWVENIHKIYDELHNINHAVNNNFLLCPLDNEAAKNFSKICGWEGAFFDKIATLRNLKLTLANKIWLVNESVLEFIIPINEISFKKIKYFKNNAWLLKSILLKN